MSSTASVNSSMQDGWRKPGRVFRARLLKQDEEEGGNHFVLSPTCSIRKYFDVADRVLDQFLQHPIDSKEDLVEAFLVGNRLCRFLSNVLPTHPDYWSSSDPEIVTNRTKSHSQLVELMYFVKQLAVMIDEEEHQSYISRVLDSSSTDNSARMPASVYSKSKNLETARILEAPSQGFPVPTKPNGATSVETVSSESGEARDPSLGGMTEGSLVTEETEENFDAMWAKVANTTANSPDVNVRTRPLKNPNLEGPEPVRASSADGWHSFSEDASWSKFSLSVSSSKFQVMGEAQRDDFEPPRVVESKRKKKKAKPQLAPIEHVEEVPTFPETQLEKRLRRAQRNLENMQSAASVEDDYPPPPESDYPKPLDPPREPPMHSPTNVLQEWPIGWETLPTWEDDSPDVSLDDTKISLMSEGDKSAETQGKSQRLTRRQRAIKGLKCVKCLIE